MASTPPKKGKPTSGVRGPGGPQVVVGDALGCPPHLDVGDQFGVEAGEMRLFTDDGG